MEESFAQRIQSNPFYKMNKKQKKEVEEINRKPMIVFGVVDKHDQTVPMHDVALKRVAHRK